MPGFQKGTTLGPYAAGLFAALAGAYGSGVGGLAGGLAGAVLGGAIAGMAIILATATEVFAATAARAAAAFAIAASIGYVSYDSPLIPPVIDSGTVVERREILHRCVAAASKGAVQIALPAVFLGIVLTGQSVGRFGPVFFSALLLGVWWGGERLFAIIPPAIQTRLADFTMSPVPEIGNAPPLPSWFASLVVLAGLLTWAKFIQGNRIAFRLGLWGLAAGGLAFALTQAVGEAIAWLPESLTAGALGSGLRFLRDEPFRSMMCGAIWSGILCGAAWRTRKAFVSSPDMSTLRLPWEVGLLVVHVTILMASLFVPQPPSGGMLATYGRVGLVAAALPIACCLTGKRVPWLLLLPVTAAPVIGAALHHAVYESHSMTVDLGWLLVVAMPLAILGMSAVWAINHDQETLMGRAAVPLGMTFLVCIGAAFGLSAVLLDFSWPWQRADPHAPALTALMGLAAILALIVIRNTAAATSSNPASKDELQARIGE